MAGKRTSITIAGVKAKRGEKMIAGKGWRLVRVKGRRVFVGTLLDTFHLGGRRKS